MSHLIADIRFAASALNTVEYILDVKGVVFLFFVFVL